MARSRLELQGLLSSIPGVVDVYYSTPTSKNMSYPCIKYELNNVQNDSADNLGYIVHNRYTATVIDPDPDSKIPTRLMDRVPYCQMDRSYRANDLTHFVFTIFY